MPASSGRRIECRAALPVHLAQAAGDYWHRGIIECVEQAHATAVNNRRRPGKVHGTDSRMHYDAPARSVIRNVLGPNPEAAALIKVAPAASAAPICIS